MLKMCNPKIKIILKEKPGKPSFEPHEKMKLNMDFSNNSIRFNLVPVLSSIKMAEGAGGIKSTADLDQELQKERSMIVDAVIVRIMKARKVEVHQKLVEACIKQTTMFQAQPQMIKKRIESLIDREYLERDTNDKSRYIYKP
jgi:cullin 3